MQEDHPPRGPLRFGIFELDLRAGELRKQGRRVRLQEQPFQVLAILVEHCGEIVSREELRNRLWTANTFVDFDHGLNKAINKIREALGDSATNPRFVETVARRGYRFLDQVRAVGTAAALHPPEAAIAAPAAADPGDRRASAPAPPQPTPSPPSAAPVRRRRSASWPVAAAVLLVLMAALSSWQFYSRLHPFPVIRSLAVLPLESLSNDASQDYFADGMTDQLISDLSQLGELRVISRTSVMAYKRARKPIGQIARELNVDAVVEGSVFRSGDQVRITAQLIEANADKHLWSQSYEGELRDALALQSKVARAIADQVRINLNPQEQAALKAQTVVTPEAYESYLKGRYFWNKRTADGLKVALAYFNQAIEEDPGFARAYSGLADTYALLGDWEYAVMPAAEALPKAKAAAIKALELDSTLGEAHNSLAFSLDVFEWDLDSAGKEFRRAIQLNPGYATAHQWYAAHLLVLGQEHEAIQEMKKAKSLDPLSLIIGADLADFLIIAHAYDESIQESRKTIELDPNFALAHNQLGVAYLQEQRTDEAIAELQKAVRLSGSSPTCIANLARAYVLSGQRNQALALLDDLEQRSTASDSHVAEIAMIYVALGDADQAMRWLEKGYHERFNPSVLRRTGFDPLRSDPRFADLLHRIGLPR